MSHQASLGQSLAGQQALVTGAASGIGRETALGLAKSGANVAINFTGASSDAENLVQEIVALGRQSIAVRGDVGKECDVTKMFENTISAFGQLDILICNAGIQNHAELAEMRIEQWDSVIRTNLTGQFLCMREAVRHFLKRGPTQIESKAIGKIVCISSIHQSVPWAGHTNYAASKGGLHMLMSSAALELAPKKIRINSIAPGAIKTPINFSAWNTDVALTQLNKQIPYGHIGKASDVAAAAIWLCSDASDYITGATLVVDGGLSLRI